MLNFLIPRISKIQKETILNAHWISDTDKEKIFSRYSEEELLQKKDIDWYWLVEKNILSQKILLILLDKNFSEDFKNKIKNKIKF